MNTDFKGHPLPIEGLNSPKLRAAYDYWRERCGTRAMPSRDDIRPEDMVGLLGNAMLVDVTYDPPDLRYRLFGSDIANAHGADFTGRSVKDLEPEGFNDLIWRQYMEVVASREPRVHKVIYQTETKASNYERITLPLSSDGKRVDMLLAVSEYEKRFWQDVEQDAAAASVKSASGW
ncbi:MAG: PAS domain-containing protein [Alphaproteobacteria bacterium]|nr:PAS domain-containing protein [Alphaproteobacteria bacterium]